MTIRPYDSERDREAARRIWMEVGWVEKDKAAFVDDYIACGRGVVAEVDGQAESLVLTVAGALRYLHDDLPASCVTGVTTSRVARKQGLAGKLTARAVAADAADGAMVAALGMFEQGYYNRLGFGTGGYEHEVAFDPARLRVPGGFRTPRRLAEGDWQMMHAARLARHRTHGSINILPAGITHCEVREEEHQFGLGYCDGPGGELTHYVWCEADEDDESGPYRIGWLVYRTREQFRELMALLQSLGDQVHLMKMTEPPGVQLQDLLRQPFHMQSVTRGSRFEASVRAHAYWQMRICDLPGCVARTRLPGREVRFNLRLDDPIGEMLPDDAAWRGVGGDYVVTLGPESRAEPGQALGLPPLACTVGAFTRLWLGVLPASSLAATDDLRAPEELLSALDEAVRLPRPQQDWDF